MATPPDPVTTALTRWRNNLIDLTRRNPLLSLKPNRTSYLEIVQPDLAKVYETLLIQGKSWSFRLPDENAKPPKKNESAKAPPAPRSNELVTAEKDRAAVVKILTNLYRRALSDYRERGLHILFLAIGVLEWRDENDEVFRSPILLAPVKLERHSLQEPFQLRAIDEDPFINPALAARLKQDFDFRLPDPPEDWNEKSPTVYLDQVRAAIAGLPGWDVSACTILTWFCFFKGVIFQDLQENAARVQAHPLVQTLAGAPVSWPKRETLAEIGLDARQDPQATFHILDADGSQRLCLEAAAQGENFVLIGPPGTGKSQTIANLIADNIARGKRVLFVSEKMAALEVVYKRLCHVGLGEFCLELHSHKANKREVIKELARSFQERLPSQPQPGDDDFQRLKQRRDYLNLYMQALHARREPMQRTVWEALADLPRWRDIPMIPLGLPAARQAGDTSTQLAMLEFTPGHFDELQQLLQRLQNHWHIRTDKNYPWRGFKADRYTLQLRDEVVSLIDKVRSRGDKLRAAAAQYANALGVQGSIANLLRLGNLLESRPPNTEVSWLSIPDLSGVIDDFEKCADQYQRLGQKRKPLTEKYGSSLWTLPPSTAGKIEQAWKDATPLLAAADERGADFLKLNHKLRAWTAETQKRIPGWLTEIRTLEKWLAAPLPVGAGSTAAAGSEARLDPSIAGVRAFLRLATFGISDARPDKAWLEDRQLAKDALDMVVASKEAFVRYKKNRQTLLKTYDAKLFDLDLARIGQAYAGWYRNWLCVFSWQYRVDRRAIAKCRPMEDIPATVADDMQLGAQLHADRAQLLADQPRRSTLLGRYEKGLDTDIENAESAAKHAVEAHELAQDLEWDRIPPKCGEALTTATATEKIRAAVKRLSESFVAWTHLTHEVKAILPAEQIPGISAVLDDASLSAVLNFARTLQGMLNHFGGLADSLIATKPPADMVEFLSDLKQAEELRAWELAQATEAERWSSRFGPAFQGVGTDWESLRKAITWSRRVRECMGAMQDSGDKAPPLQGAALLNAATATPPNSRDLRHALTPYEQELHHFAHRFESPGPTIDGKPLHEHSPEIVLDVLARWRDRVGELSDWLDWRFLPERFNHLGLGTFWNHLQQQDIIREQVVDLFRKSFWSGWLDAMFQSDPILGKYRRDEHERLLLEFRELDRKILRQGGARIAAILEPSQSSRNSDDAELALLMKEAHKKTKHLPLRRLFENLPTLLLQLKPCLLMSPLSVSQYLPAQASHLQFDLVVFDEASQILPEDAIGAIYRGKQLVVTGDKQQLPPTLFFQQGTDDGGEEEESPLFESVLDACLGAGLPQRMLRWHYRSQDEALIAFSNETYYDGQLVTFPAASFAQSTRGVQLCHVPDGIYDRGGRRDNPREAQVVAERVLEHFRTTPEKTLGVIAFSYAQMDAIADEIDRRLRNESGLERYFSEDRLEGFFVKNLETVQGDERDVIFLSVGYGRDAQGKIELNFGPLNREGGERRLNVAVTRARQRLIVASSIRASDLTLSDTQARGLKHLQRYLDFAEKGYAALAGERSDARLPLSSLHEDVVRELRNFGYECDALIGCGVFRVDLGVRDPRGTGRYLLGIEFDGPMHAQSPTARDRERIRFEVLQRLGWKLHRIGTPDWLFRREEELARLRIALSESPGKSG